jgi:very-short-patch-repair endonuclease
MAEMAAVLACGETARLSNGSAAVLWQLLIGPGTAEGRKEVTITRGHRARHPGLLVHRARTLMADEVTEREGIPVTTVARTLYDLARRGASQDLERAFAQAIGRGLVTRAEILTLLARHAGARRLRALVEGEAEVSLTRSEAENLFLALIRKAQLQRPRVNDTVNGYVVDFFWPAERFAVEVDGYAHHASATMFESDRRRDAVLAAAGVHVIRVTWRQLVNEPEALLVRLAVALARTRRS